MIIIMTFDGYDQFSVLVNVTNLSNNSIILVFDCRVMRHIDTKFHLQ